jgi:TetR/AcrR family transcriptional regulator, cholesterol catabolism regulator
MAIKSNLNYKIKAELPQTRTTPKKTRTEEVYTKAAKLFRKAGYLKTTMGEIAKALGMQKGSLYYYINDKETLLFDILDRTNDNLIKSVSNLSLQGLSSKEKIEHLIHIHILNVIHFHDEIPLLVNEIKNLRPELRELVISKREKYESFFHEVIIEGMANNTFIKHDKNIVEFWILGGVFWIFQWFNPEETRPEAIEKDFIKFFFNGLLAKKVP